ncbi:hypothetical protein [Hoeflea sp. BAL378]|nr:hypothetical protein [Hoeflea sp. BAL378]
MIWLKENADSLPTVHFRCPGDSRPLSAAVPFNGAVCQNGAAAAGTLPAP